MPLSETNKILKQDNLNNLLIQELKKCVNGLKENPNYDDEYHFKWLRIETYLDEGEENIEIIDKKIKMYKAIHWYLMNNEYITIKYGKSRDEMTVWELNEELKQEHDCVMDGIAFKIHYKYFEYINSEVNDFIKEQYAKIIKE